MEGKRITPGRTYAYREGRRRTAAVEKVEALAAGRGAKWKVQFLSGEAEGQTDFVRSAEILCEWREHESYLKAEAQDVALREHSRDSFPGWDHVVARAIDAVLECTGEDVCTGNDGVMVVNQDALARVASRAEIKISLGYREFKRGTDLHLGFDTALRLARAFAESNPALVLAHVRAELADTRSEAEGFGGSDSFNRQLLLRQEAIFALVREWCSDDNELLRLQEENYRLRSLLDQTARTLIREGHHTLGRRIEAERRRSYGAADPFEVNLHREERLDRLERVDEAPPERSRPSEPAPEKYFVSEHEAAWVLGISRYRVRQLLDEGGLRPAIVGTRRFITRVEVERFARDGPASAEGEEVPTA